MNEIEFSALRQTISTRGTIRIVIVPITILGWATLTFLVVSFSGLPVAALLPLAVLAGGFEAVHALHVSVERIGRYLQVFHERAGGWETVAMQVGPALPGGGVDPLFSVLFLGATAVNLLPVLLPQPTALEIGAVGVMHLAFALRVVRARRAAARQRAVELERFRSIKAQAQPGATPPNGA